MLTTQGKQGAALGLLTAMRPYAVSVATGIAARWRRQLLPTNGPAASTLSNNPGPLPGVEPHGSAADQAQGRMNVHPSQPNQHLPDPAAPDAPLDFLHRISEGAQVMPAGGWCTAVTTLWGGISQMHCLGGP